MKTHSLIRERSDEACPDAGAAFPTSAMADSALSSCSGGESFALMVLGDSMLPEFAEGEIIIIEPDGLVYDGAYVLARVAEEWIFRQIVRRGQAWSLRALNNSWPEQTIASLDCVKGVIIQKALPGRRRASKRYGLAVKLGQERVSST